MKYLFLSLLLLCSFANAEFQDTYQSTYIVQKKPEFYSPYSGPLSLSGDAEKSYSFTTTAFLGYKHDNLEVFVNPEIVQGIPLSNLDGLGGISNGELQKVGGPHPKLYRARLFARYTYGLGGSTETLQQAQNQFSQQVDHNRLVFTVGNYALPDIFDSNSFAHDPRSQYMNWSFMDYGAYDFAADSRGYTRGAAVELYYNNFVFRYSRTLLPILSNGLMLNSHISDIHSDNFEVEYDYSEGGIVRYLTYRNTAVMANYLDAVESASPDSPPDISQVRHKQSKTGYGVSLEQKLTDNVGVFARWSEDDGQGEEFCFTEIDRSFSTGVSVKFDRDVLGVAYANNNISGSHIQYLANGGLGYVLGDGQLPHYKPEQIGEIYYNAQITKHLWVTPDYQRISHPGYNSDRGPVDIYSIRFHMEY